MGETLDSKLSGANVAQGKSDEKIKEKPKRSQLLSAGREIRKNIVKTFFFQFGPRILHYFPKSIHNIAF
jgi:hypothetical protein